MIAFHKVYENLKCTPPRVYSTMTSVQRTNASCARCRPRVFLIHKRGVLKTDSYYREEMNTTHLKRQLAGNDHRAALERHADAQLGGGVSPRKVPREHSP